MSTFFMENFGCRATEADAAALSSDLRERGLAPCADAAEADFVVLNTCTVTAAADSQAREAIRKIHRANPKAKIVVTGCYAQRAAEELAAIEGVSYVVGNARQQEIPRLIVPEAAWPGLETGQTEQAPLSLAQGPTKILTSDIFEQTTVELPQATLGRTDRTRPILKIQDGCNNRCAYCVIPFVRGRSRSLAPSQVIEAVRRLVAAGAKEIVLSGINLGSYGRDLTPRASLGAVMLRILKETALERLRLSSIEPHDVTEDFVSLASSARLARHFHVPLQSGSDRILRAMHRWYRREIYAERIRTIGRLLPDAAIGADVIVGFPGESESDFRLTVEFIKQMPFAYLHVFSFSARPGTQAEALGEAVPPELIRTRARALRALSASKATSFRASQAGRRLLALTLERKGEGWTEALTSNYLRVRVDGHQKPNQWRDVIVSCDAREICAERGRSALENHLGQGQIAAVGDRERNALYAQPVGELPRDTGEI